MRVTGFGTLGLPRRAAGAALATSLGFLGSCGGPAEERRPDVLLLTLDTTRSDRLGCYGYAGGRTDEIDRSAARGILFERAYCAAPITLPSHISILTGVYPREHEVRNNGMFFLNPEAETLAEVLRDAGYRTGAFVTSYIVDARFGIDQGFEEFPHPVTMKDAGSIPMTEIRGEVAVSRAIEWLKTLPRDAPCFLWLHLYDPHRPWEAPEPYASELADGYDAELAYCDDQYARLLEAFEQTRGRDHLLQVITADHGESGGEHGEDTHGVLLYEGPMRVPLIFVPPPSAGAIEPRRLAQRVSNVAISPTLLELLGLPRERMPDSQIAPLLGADWTPAEPEDGPILLESYLPFYSYRWAPVEGMLVSDLKYLFSKRSEIFDLASDPLEERNLHDDPDLRRRLESQLEAARRRHPPLGWQGAQEVDENTRRSLEALGYTAGEHGTPDFSLPDGKDLVQTIGLCDDVLGLLNQARYYKTQGDPDRARDTFAQAEKVLREAEAIDSEGFAPAILRGRLYMYQDQKDRAIPYFEKALMALPSAAAVHCMLGRCYLATGQNDWAIEEFQKTIYLEPLFLEAYQELGNLLAARNEFGQAVYFGELMEKTLREQGVNPDFRVPALVSLRQRMIAAGQSPTPPDPPVPESLLAAGTLARMAAETDS